MIDPKHRSFRLLSKAEAKTILDAYVATLPDRVDAFLDEVRRRGGPVDALDFSRASMRPLWTWYIADLRLPDPPTSDEEMREAGPPWWYDFHAPLGQRLGPDLARLVTNMAAYFVECVLRQRPDARLTLGRAKRGVDYNMPLLEIGAGAAGGTVDQMFISLTNQASMGAVYQLDPGRLEAMFDQWTTPPTPVPVATAPPFSVELIEGVEPSDFTHVISFDDVVAHEREGRVKRLVRRLGSDPVIERAVHEDREIVLIRAPNASVEQLMAIVDRLWTAARSAS
jgi:hypothetical protein